MGLLYDNYRRISGDTPNMIENVRKSSSLQILRIDSYCIYIYRLFPIMLNDILPGLFIIASDVYFISFFSLNGCITYCVFYNSANSPKTLLLEINSFCSFLPNQVIVVASFLNCKLSKGEVIDTYCTCKYQFKEFHKYF